MTVVEHINDKKSTKLELLISNPKVPIEKPRTCYAQSVPKITLHHVDLSTIVIQIIHVKIIYTIYVNSKLSYYILAIGYICTINYNL